MFFNHLMFDIVSMKLFQKNYKTRFQGFLLKKWGLIQK